MAAPPKKRTRRLLAAALVAATSRGAQRHPLVGDARQRRCGPASPRSFGSGPRAQLHPRGSSLCGGATARARDDDDDDAAVVAAAAVVFPAGDAFDETLAWLTQLAGGPRGAPLFRVREISPADSPAVAVLETATGLALRLTRDAVPDGGPPALCLRRARVDDKTTAVDGGHNALRNEHVLVAPNGARLELVDTETSRHAAATNRHDPLPGLAAPFVPAATVVTSSSSDAATSSSCDEGFAQGRAGMLYRDLLPGRLGGTAIASLIRIPKGGPVADYPHFHRVAFQLIYVLRGTVEVAYEGCPDGPILLGPGDFVTQPPTIRHQVLECSDGLEVLEVTLPADHATEACDADFSFADLDEMQPATTTRNAVHKYGGQTFVWYRHEDVEPQRDSPGYDRFATPVARATGGLADVARFRRRRGRARSLRFELSDGAGASFAFLFALRGSATLALLGRPGASNEQQPADEASSRRTRFASGTAACVPAALHASFAVEAPSRDFEFLCFRFADVPIIHASRDNGGGGDEKIAHDAAA